MCVWFRQVYVYWLNCRPLPRQEQIFEHPILFMKANSAIVGQMMIFVPRGSTNTDWEVELGVIIGDTAKYVTEDDALDYVAGYCV